MIKQVKYEHNVLIEMKDIKLRINFNSIVCIILEFVTILTSVELDKHGKKMFKLPKSEEERINNILKRAFDKESGKLNENDVRLTEDNPDGRKFIFLPYTYVKRLKSNGITVCFNYFSYISCF